MLEQRRKKNPKYTEHTFVIYTQQRLAAVLSVQLLKGLAVLSYNDGRLRHRKATMLLLIIPFHLLVLAIQHLNQKLCDVS